MALLLPTFSGDLGDGETAAQLLHPPFDLTFDTVPASPPPILHGPPQPTPTFVSPTPRADQAPRRGPLPGFRFPNGPLDG